MSGFVDLTTPPRTYDVCTAEKRGGSWYMGPTVRINARSESDAKTRAEQAGYTPNDYFPPKEVKSR